MVVIENRPLADALGRRARLQEACLSHQEPGLVEHVRGNFQSRLESPASPRCGRTS